MDIIKFRGVVSYTTPGDSTARSHLSALFGTSALADTWVFQEETTLSQMDGVRVIQRGVIRYTTRTTMDIEWSN